MDEEASKNKRRMLGNIKFIGELFKLKVIILTILLFFYAVNVAVAIYCKVFFYLR